MKSNAHTLPWRLQSVVPGAVWPAIPAPGAATALALLQQLEQSQWLEPHVIESCQLRQLSALLNHAWTTVPWYRERWQGLFDPAAPITRESLERLPLLTRRDLQDGFDALKSSQLPREHGQAQVQRTSGSTGAPVHFLTTSLTTLYWNVFTLRDHLWHHRDLGQKLAVVRFSSKLDRARNWGSATAGLVETGPAVGHSIQADVDELLTWLDTERPGYFSTHPSILESLARRSIERGVRLEGLLEVRTLAESLGPDLRALCRQAWDVPLTDVYSTTDTGYVALQCPEHTHYHVQAEGVLVEILDQHDRPCAPGEIGRVVISTLQNFAMPLIRYDIGDYAEVGPPCPCGRGLPVLTRILGRVRNMLVTADGKSYWPAFSMVTIRENMPIRQWQFVQKTPVLLEARIVADAPLSEAQEAELRKRVLSKLPSGLELRITYCEKIERSASGKFEDFYSEVTRAGHSAGGASSPALP
jgi:phenylacetate-CoA ligase